MTGQRLRDCQQPRETETCKGLQPSAELGEGCPAGPGREDKFCATTYNLTSLGLFFFFFLTCKMSTINKVTCIPSTEMPPFK